ncbi:MAG: hypothetical protein IJH92_03050 [Mogibacterium sp.]|nr:hypothetical protein [Clostridia bacterium]MBR0307849.1 hypothetical protein [Mogibacterium sp.]
MTIEELLWFIITAVLSFVIGILLNQLRNRINKEVREENAIKNGLRCLLRENIIAICDRCLERGSMKMHDLESLEDMAKEYRALDGNGSVEKLIQDTKKLGIK